MPSVTMGDNKVSIFCATRTGQIRHILALIKQYKTENNVLVVVTTSRDIALRENMKKTIPNNLFSRVVYQQIEDFPASRNATVIRHVKVYRQLKNGIKAAAENAVKVDLYLCHLNNFYAFFPSILDELQVDYTLNLVEEGLATYKWGIPEVTWGAFNWNEELDGAVTSDVVKLRAAKLGENVLALLKSVLLFWVPILNAAVKIIYHFALLIVSLLSILTKKNLVSTFCSINNVLMPRKYRYAVVPRFDRGYFCFPDKMKNVREFKIDNILPLELVVDDSKPIAESKAIFDMVPDGIPIFASQKYGDYEMYYRIVFDILQDMGIEEVYFKFHPREELQDIRKLFEAEAAKHPDITIWNDPEYDGMNMEKMLLAKRFSHVIGLTTSALMYCSLMDIDTEPISIVEEFKSRYLQISTQEQRIGVQNELKEIERDYLIFRDAANVTQFARSAP